MANNIQIEALADAVTDVMQEYRDLTVDALDAAVKKTADAVKKQIQSNAPRSSRNGKHHWQTWSVKETMNTSVAKQKTVYARTPRGYALAHLLENGHKVRGGDGSTRAFHYIAPAEEMGAEMLENEIKKSIGG